MLFFVDMFLFLLSKYLGVEFLGYRVVYGTFSKTQSGCTISHTYIAVCDSPSSSIASPTFDIVSLISAFPVSVK